MAIGRSFEKAIQKGLRMSWTGHARVGGKYKTNFPNLEEALITLPICEFLPLPKH
jgi:carbamoylphosphate synthase large subunit